MKKQQFENNAFSLAINVPIYLPNSILKVLDIFSSSICKQNYLHGVSIRTFRIENLSVLWKELLKGQNSYKSDGNPFSHYPAVLAGKILRTKNGYANMPFCPPPAQVGLLLALERGRSHTSCITRSHNSSVPELSSSYQ